MTGVGNEVGAHLHSRLLGEIAKRDEQLRREGAADLPSRDTVADTRRSTGTRSISSTSMRSSKSSARSTAAMRSGLRETWLIGWPFLILGNSSVISRL
jgi:hypothetical protein